MYELKKIGKIFTGKFVGTGPSSYKKRIYRALASTIPGRERPEETTICYKISLVQLITNLHATPYT